MTSAIPTTPTLGQSFSKTLLDPLKAMFNRGAKPTAPATPVYPTPTGAPIPTSMTGTGAVGPVAPRPVAPVINALTPGQFNGMPAIPQVKAPTAPVAPMVVNTGAPTAPVTPPVATGTPATPPPAPTALETANTSDSAALAQYLKDSQMTDEEKNAQATLDALTESTKTAFLNTEGQPIPLEFITGQKSAIEKRATNLAEPLQNKLARLQAARTASLNASKFALDRADKAVESAKSDTKPVAGSSFYDPTTKTWITAPEKAKAPEPFTLGAGDIRYDANGKVIARGAPKPLSDAAIAKADDAATAKKNANTQVLSNISLIDDILKNPGAISGPIQTGMIPFTAGAKTKNQYDQLKGLLSLDKRALLKGSGAISDFEAKTLDKAASDLGRNESEDDFTSSLKKLRGVFSTAAGLEAPVKVVNVKTGESITSTATRDEINKLIAEGNTVEYQ